MAQEKRFGLIEIRAEFVDEWKKWGSELMSAENAEALASLGEEGCTEERMFLLEIDSKWYVGFFSSGEHKPANMARPVNQKHKALLEKSTVRRIEGSPLYSLERKD